MVSDPGILGEKLNCTPYLEIRRGRTYDTDTKPAVPMISIGNSDISCHKQRTAYTIPCRSIPKNESCLFGVAPLLIDRLMRA